MVRLRLAPRTIGQPSEWKSARPFISSRLWATDLPKPKPGSMRMFERVDARTFSGDNPLFQPFIDLDEHVLVARIVLHRLRSALVMHEDDGIPEAAMTPLARGSKVSADTSLTSRAPAPSAAS